MTLREAMTYMYQNPFVKMECGPWMFENKWIMWTDEKLYGFMLYDCSEPDIFWWKDAISWGYDWWVKE